MNGLNKDKSQSSCVEFLSLYPHPAFIISTNENSFAVIYSNPAFDQTIHSPNVIDAIPQPSQRRAFKRWLVTHHYPTFFLQIEDLSLDVTKTRMEKDIWACTTVPRLSPLLLSHKRKLSIFPSFPSTPNPTNHLLLRSYPSPPIEHGKVSVDHLLETFDWSSTSLGPRHQWPQSLKSALSFVLAAPYASALFWGPDMILIYNEAYSVLAGSKHPHIWGQSLAVSWAELWDEIESSAKAVKNGVSTYKHDDLLFLERLTDARLPEESYLTWSYTPVRQEDGSVGGIINVALDTTDKVIAKRRMDTLRDVIGATILSSSSHDFSQSLVSILSKDEYSYDVSFGAFYFCSIDTIQEDAFGVSLNLAGRIAIPVQDVSTPDRLSISIRRERSDAVLDPLDATVTLCPWPFVLAIETRQVVHIPTLSPEFVKAVEPRGWGDRPREAVVIPIGFEDQPVPTALLVLGLNTRRPYDAAYQANIDVLRMTLSSTLHATLTREAEVKRAKQLAELDAAKTTFFSNASHELRTPLTLIGGPLDECIGQLPNGPVRNSLKMAQRNVHRLKRLVDSLMDFSKLAANRLDGQFRPVKLGLFTADLASLFRAHIEKSGLVYRVECDSKPDQPLCYIDTDLWEKVVFNIVGNAFKYTLKGSITVSVVHTTRHAVLTVSDTGVGIPESDIEKIFQRFHRVQTTSRSHEGTGIGLALTKELVALHGGRLAVQSVNDPQGRHGTQFTVTIPLGKKHLPTSCVYEDDLASGRQGDYARGVIEEAALWNSRSPSVTDEGSEISEEPELASRSARGRLDPSTMFFLKSDVVLLVDDNEDMRRYVKSILSRYCTVVEAKDGQQALNIASSIRPNLVLSDVMMPVMDGFALLKALRERPETSLIPVILVTARSGDDNRVEGLLSGADDYLAKPFKGAELVARVHLQMQLGKKRVEMEAKFAERTLEIKQLSEMSPVAIFRADTLGRITYVNPRWYDITGHPRDRDLAQWSENLHSEDQERVLSWWMDACQDRACNCGPTTIDFRWKSGHWCQGQFVSMDGRGAFGAFTDISERKKLEADQLAHALEKEANAQKKAEEAEQRRKEAEERRRGQELLIDVTSHELRQPVSAILNCSSLVRLNLSNLYNELVASGGVYRAKPSSLQTIKEDLDALDSIYQCGLAQERIANDVLSLSRIQLNVLSIHPTEFDLENEVGRVVALFRNEARMKSINLDVSFGDSLGALGVKDVSSDKARFGQVITNLLSNAIKFTDTSKDKRDISIKVDVAIDPPPPDSCQPPKTGSLSPGFKVAAGQVLFIFVAVTDSGPGLDPEDLSLLFKRFQQGSNSHDVFGGSGLGLFVSRKLCTLMGGRIDVSSTPGQGATFRFFIQATAAASSPTTPQSSLSSVILASPSDSATLHVLITEDNLINQTILNRQLKKAGCTTALANNGQQAIDHLVASDKPFDAILMDIEMPVLDGLSAVRQIRSMEAAGKLKQRHRVFALTANAREGQVQNILEAGMDGVMIKPYRIDELLKKLRSHLT